MTKIRGWLTLAELVGIAVAIEIHVSFDPAGYPVPITLLCMGAVCSLLSGIPWAHTRGSRGLKAAFLGLVGYAGGIALGLFLSNALGSAVVPSREAYLGVMVLLLIVGWSVGGILFASLGVWSCIRFHRRYVAKAGTVRDCWVTTTYGPRSTTRTFWAGAVQAFALPRTSWLAGPMSAREKLSNAPKKRHDN